MKDEQDRQCDYNKSEFHLAQKIGNGLNNIV